MYNPIESLDKGGRLIRRGVYAQMMELVDMHASGACVARRGGSNPPLGRLC